MISIELNELNKDWINHYIAQGKLRNFASLLAKNSFTEITSERTYENLEPWIQWPTFYSGLSYEEHGCFHIGDFYKKGLSSIYSKIQEKGDSVLAVSPMNCYFEEKNNSFFLPDPWEEFETKDHGFISTLYKSIQKKVNTNSAGKTSIYDLMIIFIGLIYFARPKNYFRYLRSAILSISYKWHQAIFLDIFLTDLFLHLYKRKGFTYSSIFLNAGAHIQHHYLYDSECYSGEHRNPVNYSKASSNSVDPVYEIYETYDYLIEDLIKLDNKFMITTGLSQIENKKPYYQYRFKNFYESLEKFNIRYASITPRMSRDFTLSFDNIDDLKHSERVLKTIKINGENLFSTDPDYKSLTIFTKISWHGEKDAFRKVIFEDKIIDLESFVSTVSIENSIHSSKGWHANSFSNELKNNELNGLKNMILNEIYS